MKLLFAIILSIICVSTAYAQQDRPDEIRYSGIMQANYLFDTNLKVKPLGEDSFFADKAPVISNPPGKVNEQAGYQFFIGSQKTNKRVAYEYTVGSIGTKETSYEKGQKFTLNGEEHEFTTNSTVTISGFYMTSAAKTQLIRKNGMSLYIRPMVGMRIVDYAGSGRYKINDPDCAESFSCQDEDAINFATVDGSDNIYFTIIPIGIDYITEAGKGIRVEYNPKAQEVNFGWIF